VTWIEAEVMVAAPAPAVWDVLIDHERWPEWFRSADGSVRLDHVELRTGPGDRVGAVRRCVATVTSVPLLGGCELGWTEQLADVRRPWVMEYDLAGHRGRLRRARSRVMLLECGAGRTRIRWRISYTPCSMVLRLADRLCLRYIVSRGLHGALANLSARWPAAGLQPEGAAPGLVNLLAPYQTHRAA
jgi:hypothetical protein